MWPRILIIYKIISIQTHSPAWMSSHVHWVRIFIGYFLLKVLYKLSIEKNCRYCKKCNISWRPWKDHWRTVPGICRDMFRWVSDRIKLVNNCRWESCQENDSIAVSLGSGLDIKDLRETFVEKSPLFSQYFESQWEVKDVVYCTVSVKLWPPSHFCSFSLSLLMFYFQYFIT